MAEGAQAEVGAVKGLRGYWVESLGTAAEYVDNAGGVRTAVGRGDGDVVEAVVVEVAEAREGGAEAGAGLGACEEGVAEAEFGVGAALFADEDVDAA